jgi:outer membrane immunogenic protein
MDNLRSALPATSDENRSWGGIPKLHYEPVTAIISGDSTIAGGQVMSKFILTTAAVFGAALAVIPALADEAPAEPKHVVRRAAPAPVRAAPVQQAAAPQSNWTGSQVGGQGGVSSMSQGFAEPGAHLCEPSSLGFVDPCIETPFDHTGHATSATVGGFLGYRIQFGTMVYGIETDLNYKSASNSWALSDTNFFRNETFTGTIKQTWDGSVRGRAGYLVTPWTLVYGTAGVAYGDVSGSFGYSANDIFGFGYSTTGGGSWSDTRVGWTAGGGVETIITAGMTLRLEYRYTDLGSYSKSLPLSNTCPGGVCPSSPSYSSIVNLQPRNNTVRVGLGLNF